METDPTALPAPGTGRSAPLPAEASPGGGLIVMVRPDPAAAARALARDLHAQLVVGGEATWEALDQLDRLAIDTAPDLDALAAAMRRAEEVRARTRDVAAERIAASLNTRLAIHPATIRAAATELITARALLADEVRRAERRRAVITRIEASAVGALVAAGVAVGALASVPVGAALVVAGAVVAGVLGLGRRTGAAPQASDPHAARRAVVDVAHRRWVQVAGTDADPTEVEALIHRYDPQHHVVADLVASSTAVRAVERAAVVRRAAWVSAWRAETGDRAPLAPSLAEVLGRPDAELWLGVDRTPGPDTLVVAQPYADLTEDRARELHQRLLALPERQRVIVVLAPDPDAPAGARLPGIGWVAAHPDA